MTGRTAWVACVFLVCVAGCAVARRGTVSIHEYDAYRRFRVAPSVERKLAAGFEYLRGNPRGAYRREVAGWFLKVEPDYVDRAWDDLPRLRSFLSAVSSGPQADRAAARIVELELTVEGRLRRERAFEQKISMLEGRLAAADAGRRSLITSLAGWVRRLAAVRSWGGRTSELDHELIYAYRLSPPSARCTDEGCVKTVTVAYAVPEGRAQSEREALFDVRLRLERGGVRAATITGPDLFTRLGEALRASAVDAGDWVGRAEAIGQAAQLIALSVEPLMPSATCSEEPVSPVVLQRACNGVRLKVICALELGEEDRILIEPVSGP